MITLVKFEAEVRAKRAEMGPGIVFVVALDVFARVAMDLECLLQRACIQADSRGHRLFLYGPHSIGFGDDVGQGRREMLIDGVSCRPCSYIEDGKIYVIDMPGVGVKTPDESMELFRRLRMARWERKAAERISTEAMW